MKFRVTLSVNLELADTINRLGPYRRAKYVKEALLHFIKTPQGQRLLNELVTETQVKKDKESNTINLDDLM